MGFAMNVAELQAKLASLDPELELMIALHGDFVPIAGVVSAPGSFQAVIRGRGKPQCSSRFSVQEDGLIGHLTTLGVSDQDIAVVLGRPTASVTRRKKALKPG
jgi:hypothetical protein